MREQRGIFASGTGVAVGAQNLGGVVGGIEADAEQVGFAVAGGIGADLVVDGGELVADARAEVGERAARVDESEKQGLAPILTELDGLAVLVDELEVRHVIAGSRDVQGRAGLAGGSFRMRGDFDVLQPVFVLLDDDIGADRVAGLQLIEIGSRLDGIRHNHAVHEARDGFVVDVGRVRVLIHRDYVSLQGITLGAGLSGGGAGH